MNDKKITFGIDWTIWSIILGIIVFDIWLIATNYETRGPSELAPEMFIFFAVYVLFRESHHYEFTTNGIRVMVLGILRKQYHWNEIQQLIVIRKWWDGKKERTNPILLITLCGYDAFCEGYDSVVTYRKKHRGSSFLIYLNPQKIDWVINTIKELGQSVEECGYHRI